jgi:hypothetical protein
VVQAQSSVADLSSGITLMGEVSRMSQAVPPTPTQGRLLLSTCSAVLTGSASISSAKQEVSPRTVQQALGGVATGTQASRGKLHAAFRSAATGRRSVLQTAAPTPAQLAAAASVDGSVRTSARLLSQQVAPGSSSKAPGDAVSLALASFTRAGMDGGRRLLVGTSASGSANHLLATTTTSSSGATTRRRHLSQAPASSTTTTAAAADASVTFAARFSDWCAADASCSQLTWLLTWAAWYSDASVFTDALASSLSSTTLQPAGMLAGSSITAISGVLEAQVSSRLDQQLCSAEQPCTATFTLPLDPATAASGYSSSRGTACILLQPGATAGSPYTPVLLGSATSASSSEVQCETSQMGKLLAVQVRAVVMAAVV